MEIEFYRNIVSIIIAGFAGAVFGFLVPSASSRFGKIMPCDPGTAIISIFHRSYAPRCRTLSHHIKFQKLCKRLLLSSIMCALLTSFISIGVVIFAEPQSVLWFIALVWLLILSAAVDQRFNVLPDIITIPLLVLGFASSIWGGVLTPESSAAGALTGYFVPMAAGALMYFRQPHAIGGGDVKMLTALGAWLGPILLSYAIVLSFVTFGCIAVISGKKAGPYGAALAIGTILSLILPLP